MYVDASGSGSVFFIGLVAVENGEIINRLSERRLVNYSHDAEIEAILLAKEKYPKANIFSDDSSAAEKHGVTWISRTKNIAHSVAHRQYVNFRRQRRGLPRIEDLPSSKPKKNKQKSTPKVKYRGGYVFITLTDEHRKSISDTISELK